MPHFKFNDECANTSAWPVRKSARHSSKFSTRSRQNAISRRTNSTTRLAARSFSSPEFLGEIFFQISDRRHDGEAAGPFLVLHPPLY